MTHHAPPTTEAPGDRRRPRLRHTVARLRDDAGSQAAEYAMVGGVGAAACGGIIYLLRDRILTPLIDGVVVPAITNIIQGWLG